MFPYIRVSEAAIGNYLRRLQQRKVYSWQHCWQWNFIYCHVGFNEGNGNNGVLLATLLTMKFSITTQVVAFWDNIKIIVSSKGLYNNNLPRTKLATIRMETNATMATIACTVWHKELCHQIGPSPLSWPFKWYMYVSLHILHIYICNYIYYIYVSFFSCPQQSVTQGTFTS